MMERRMITRMTRINTLLSKIDESGHQVMGAVAEAKNRATYNPCAAHDEEAAEATDRALENSAVLVEQLRRLRCALWVGPTGL
jgi:hypothetical protein